MSRDLVRFDEGGRPARHTVRAARGISRSQVTSQVRRARAADETDVAVEKGAQFGYAVSHSMVETARINGVQKQIEEAAPELSGRLSHLADLNEWELSTILSDLGRDLRRM